MFFTAKQQAKQQQPSPPSQQQQHQQDQQDPKLRSPSPRLRVGQASPHFSGQRLEGCSHVGRLPREVETGLQQVQDEQQQQQQQQQQKHKDR